MLVGPGEGAGVVDVGDGIAVAIRIESHNHPSAIEPYQGAATGVGGILRDIFSMGARPDRADGPAALRPARRRPQPLDRRGRRRRASPATATRSACPTVGGEVVFDESLPRQPARQRAVPRRAARSTGSCSAGPTGVGNLAVLLGSSHRARRHRRRERAGVGRLRRRRRRRAKRPSVQVGDPFEEKRLIEACLALLDAGLVGRHPGPRRRRAHLRAPARRRRAAASGMDVDVAAVPLPRAGHGAVRGDDAARARSGCSPSSSPTTSTRCSRSASVGGAGHGRSGTVTGDRRRPAAHPRRLRRRRSWPTCRRRRSHERRAAVRPARCAAGRPADRGADDPAACRRPTTAAPTCSAMLADTVVGVVAVRPPAVPQHRRGPGRRRRGAAPEAPDHRRRHRPGPGAHHRRQPPVVRARPAGRHRAGRGRGGAQPRLRRRPAARRRQLPELRQPRAPRGDVAAVARRSTAWPRRAGRSALPVVGGNVSLYNETARRRHRPDAGRRRARPDRPLDVRRPGVGSPTATASCCSVASDAQLWPGRAGRRPRRTRRRARRRSTSRLHATCRHAGARARCGGHAARRARRVRRRPRAWPWPRWRCARASGCSVARSPITVLFSRGSVSRRRPPCSAEQLVDVGQAASARQALRLPGCGVATGDRSAGRRSRRCRTSRMRSTSWAHVPSFRRARRPTGQLLDGRQSKTYTKPAASSGSTRRASRSPHLTYLGPLRAAAPRPGVGRHRGERRRDDHRHEGHGPRRHRSSTSAAGRRSPGHLAIGHTRYSTTGSSTWRNAQPVYRSAGDTGFALGHNGNLTNTAELAEQARHAAGHASPATASSIAELLARGDHAIEPGAADGRRARARAAAGAAHARRAASRSCSWTRRTRHRRARPARLPAARLGQLDGGWVLA